MSENKDPMVETEQTPGARAIAEHPLGKIERIPDSLVVSRDDRMLAAAGYFAPLAGFWVLAPVAAYVVYLWNGRRSRFLGFHAVQAVLLQVALLPITIIGFGVAYSLSMLIEPTLFTVRAERCARVCPHV